ANEIKGEACHQCYCSHRCRTQHRNVVRCNNANLTHRILIGTPWPDYLNQVARRYVLQSSKKTVPVTRDPQVACLAHTSRSENPPDSSIQREVTGVVKDRHFKTYLGNT